MANIYINATREGWAVRKNGEETVHASLDDARSQHPEVTDAHAALRKGCRLMEDGALQAISTYPVTSTLSALTGQFNYKGSLYQFVRFAEQLPNGRSRVTAAQVFPLSPVEPHTDCYVSSPDALDSIGASIRTFLR